MESYLGEKTVKTIDNSGLNVSDPAEKFQKFITTLFENNGVLHDLRAYLRGHIVSVLRSVENGVPPESQKHITQRLELKFQALNVIISEYLMKLEFNYSFSVFISEIPLANMVFDFTKNMFNNSSLNDSIVQFSENDIWNILNYLGIKCDTEHALKLVKEYEKGEEPLLMCILKHTPLFIEPSHIDEDLSEDNSSTVITYTDEKSSQKSSHKCKHYDYCHSCRSRIYSVKKKYKMKKNRMVQKETMSSQNILYVDDFTRKARVVEEKLIEEMFEQLKNVYEGEMELLRIEQQKKMKRSLASHALLLQRQREELEEEMRSRRTLMEQELQERKEFVRGLAASLREAHQQLQSEQQRLQGDADGLIMRETSLKSQLQEAEESLKSRGEEMRKQISDELIVLDGHLHTMRRERDAIDRQREDLENLRRLSDANIKLLSTHSIKQNENMLRQYDSMRNELELLKKYIETTNAAKSIEKDTEGQVKNNQQQEMSDRNDDDRLKQNQVVNDFKKLKNINISNSHLSKWSRDSVTSGESQCDGACDLTLRRFREENERLEAFGKQESATVSPPTQAVSLEHIVQPVLQGNHIELLTIALRQVNQPAMTFGHSKSSGPLTERFNDDRTNDEDRSEQGAGVEVDQPAAPTAPVPGPDKSIGVRDPAASRRHFKQWKEIRQRVTHIDQPSVSRDSTNFVANGCSSSRAGLSVEEPNGTVTNENPHRKKENHKRNILPGRYITKIRDSVSLLSETKEKLRKKYKESLTRRVKSPNTMLREAKLRLRKLEIEAEAVERSYMDFRKRRADERKLFFKEDTLTKTSNAHLEYLIPKKHNDETKEGNSYAKIQDQTNLDYDKYYREFKKLDMSNVIHQNRNTAIENIKPIPHSYYEVDIKLNEEKSCAVNYLDTPLSELRKLYQSVNNKPMKIRAETSVREIDTNDSLNNALKKCKIDEKELKILQKNVNKVYNLDSQETLASKNNMDTNYLDNNIKVDFNKTTATALEDNCIKEDSNKEDKDIVAVVCNPNNEMTDLLVVDDDCEVVSKTSEAPAFEVSDNLVIDVQSSEGDINIIKSKTETAPVSDVSGNLVIDVHSSQGDIINLIESKTKTEVENIFSQVMNKPKETSIVHDTKQNSRSDKNVSLSEHDSYNNDKLINLDETSVVLNIEKSYDELNKDSEAEYADDISADVNNYSSPSEYANNSHISIIKTSENDNFWDSSIEK